MSSLADATSPATFIGDTERLRPVRIWLYTLAAMVLLMVIVGGMTRLTGSGLSITSWKPISGIIPPLTDADWAAEFAAYQQIPQYQLLNHWMSVDEFKSIFWWEWGHRFLGRIIGIAFLVPFLIFLVQKRLDRRLAPSLFALFLLGGFQGFLGWWMVSSGLTERVDVSQYRLATHLGAAAVLFVSLLWVGRRLGASPRDAVSSRWLAGIAAFSLLIFVQIIAGAFVAGLDAGFVYNTWPMMHDAWIPADWNSHSPLWLNAFDNPALVQFNHRMIAYLIVIVTGVILWRGWTGPGFSGQHVWLPVIGGLVALQVCVGIATLVLVVPLSLAILHQAMAFVLLGVCALYLADMMPRRGM